MKGDLHGADCSQAQFQLAESASALLMVNRIGCVAQTRGLGGADEIQTIEFGCVGRSCHGWLCDRAGSGL